MFVTAKIHRRLRGGWGIAGQPVVLSQRQNVTAAVLPERARLHTVGIERLGPAERFAIGHVVEVQVPARGGHVFVVARVVHQHGAHPHGLEAPHAQCLEREVVFHGRSQHLVVGGTPLGADEPVSGRAKQIPPGDRFQVVVGL